MSDPSGNIMAIYTKTYGSAPSEKASHQIYGSGIFSHFAPRMLSTSNYYPFGLAMEGRTFSSEGYRWGFNGKEDDPAFGSGIQDYGFRIYDREKGKFLSVDPLAPDYPWYTPYQFAGNMPIWASDLDGLEELIVTPRFEEKAKPILDLRNHDAELQQYTDDISKDELKPSVKVYFIVLEKNPTNGSTFDLAKIAKTIVETEKFIRQHGKDKLGKAQKKQYDRFKEVFYEVGKSAEDVIKENSNNVKNYAVGISAKQTGELSENDDRLAKAARTFYHEIIAHLTNDVKGIEKDEVTEHYDFFGLTEDDIKKDESGNVKKVRDAYKSFLDQGYSITNKKHFLKGSKAKSMSDAIDNAIIEKNKK